ncbi:hypothetical protein, partial [Rugamonas violacea]|uniref:hypothetical protein n=1 Tax=Rugamonas sp. CCM 8940 TaxID=2765359 RepID=UPI001F3CB493
CTRRFFPSLICCHPFTDHSLNHRLKFGIHYSMGRNVGWVGGQGGAALGNPAVNNIQLVIRNGNQVITGFPIR